MYMRRIRLWCCRQTKTEELLSMSFHFSTAAVKVLLDILSATPETILVLIFLSLDEWNSIPFLMPNRHAIKAKLPGFDQTFLLWLPFSSSLYHDWSTEFSLDPANSNMHERSADPGLYAAVR